LQVFTPTQTGQVSLLEVDALLGDHEHALTGENREAADKSDVGNAAYQVVAREDNF